eukprot:gene14457-biopygen11562
MMSIKLKILKCKKTATLLLRYDVKKLKDPEVAQKFKARIGGRFAPLLLINNVQEQAKELSEKMNEVALEFLRRRRSKKIPWITTDMIDSCEARSALKGRRFDSPADLDAYREANKKVKKEVKKAREEQITEQCNIIDGNMTRNPKVAFETVKKLTEKLKAARTNVIESKSGTLLSTTEEVTSRWKEYCEELYNCKADKDESILKNSRNKQVPLKLRRQYCCPRSNMQCAA